MVIRGVIDRVDQLVKLNGDLQIDQRQQLAKSSEFLSSAIFR